MKAAIVRLPYGITLRTHANGSGAITSKLREELLSRDDSVEDAARAAAACDAIESLLLALICAGVNLDSAAAHAGVRVAIECIAESL